MHYEGRTFVCAKEGCGKSFNRVYKLKEHVETVHEERKQYVCTGDGCGKRFGLKSNLKKHKGRCERPRMKKLNEAMN